MGRFVSGEGSDETTLMSSMPCVSISAGALYTSGLHATNNTSFVTTQFKICTVDTGSICGPVGSCSRRVDQFKR